MDMWIGNGVCTVRWDSDVSETATSGRIMLLVIVSYVTGLEVLKYLLLCKQGRPI